MLKNSILKIVNFKFLCLVVFVALLTMSGCKSWLFGTENPATPQPLAPPAPVVVDGVRTSYADLVEKTSPAVVRIASERKAQTLGQSPLDMFRDFFPGMPQQRQQPQPRVERGVGSGVIVSADGSVLTNFHVVDGAEKITVQTVDNKTHEAKVVGTDQPSDLAVLKIEGGNFPFLTLGNSDNVRVGDIVLAIGNPLGIGQTVTAGIISAKGRKTGLSDGTSFQDFLQTDAPINRGNSGGALVNVSGELIGINSQIVSEQGGGNIGIGFSIPSNMAKNVLEQILKDGKVHRGMLGVGINDVTEEIAQSLELKEAKGVIINSVRPGSAAEKAGIKVGDIITAINGEPTDDTNILRNKVAGTAPGTEIKVTVLRDGKTEELTATLDEFQVESAKTQKPGNEDEQKPNKESGGKLGLSLQPVTPQIARQLDLPADTKGLVVTDVDAGGASAEKGIAEGDVILQINRQPVNTLDEAQAAIDKSGSRPILLLVMRRGNTFFIPVTPKQ